MKQEAEMDYTKMLVRFATEGEYHRFSSRVFQCGQDLALRKRANITMEAYLARKK